MVQCVRHFCLTASEKKTLACRFFFPLITHSQPPQSRGFFLPQGVRR
ncbi:pyrBI operon leader peptide [Escherichia coli]|nr:pyrBI operon leader peptide [Escherichia coli]